MENVTADRNDVLVYDQIGLLQTEPNRIMVLQFLEGRVCEASFTSEERLLHDLQARRALPVVLFANTTHLAERLTAAGFAASQGEQG